MFRTKRPILVDSLRELKLFSACDEHLLRKLASLGTPVQAHPEQVLAREGKPGREFYVIVDGTAEVRHEGETLAHLGRGDFFGEMALIDGQPRSADVTAQTEMTLYVFDPREFFSLLNDFPPVSQTILRTLAERLRHAQDAHQNLSHQH
jgi:CRP-like cAMP-binding protein